MRFRPPFLRTCAPALVARERLADSVGLVPDDGEGVVIVLPGGAAEIGVEPARHVLADALTSLLAIATLLAGLFLGWRWMDAAIGIVGAAVIARWSWGLLRDTAAVLVDAAANVALEAEIREAIEDGDARIVDLHVWRVGPGKFATIVSLVARQPLSPSAYAQRVRVHEELVHVTIEPHRV